MKLIDIKWWTLPRNMAQYHGDEMEYVQDDNEMAEVDDDMYFRGGRALGESDTDEDDDDEYDPLVCFQSF